MKIFVCLKQVPDTETKIKILPDRSGIDPQGVKWVMNPYDEFAVEEAVKLKEKNPTAQVWVLTLGPKIRAAEALRTALAMGADEAIVINAPENVDALTTAKALAAVIKLEGGAQYVFSGKLSIDNNQSAVPQMVATLLDIPHSSVVSKFTPTAENLIVERDIEGGAKEIIQMMVPCSVSANKGLNMPRYASLPGIMKAKKKVIKEIEFSTLVSTSGISLDEKVKYMNYSLPAEKSAAKILSGDSQTQVGELVKLLRDEAKVL